MPEMELPDQQRKGDGEPEFSQEELTNMQANLDRLNNAPPTAKDAAGNIRKTFGKKPIPTVSCFATQAGRPPKKIDPTRSDEVAEAALASIKSDEGVAARARKDFALNELMAFADELSVQQAAGQLTASTTVSMIGGFKAAIVRLGLVTMEEIDTFQAVEVEKLRQEFGGQFPDASSVDSNELKAAAARRLAQGKGGS